MQKRGLSDPLRDRLLAWLYEYPPLKEKAGRDSWLLALPEGARDILITSRYDHYKFDLRFIVEAVKAQRLRDGQWLILILINALLPEVQILDIWTDLETLKREIERELQPRQPFPTGEAFVRTHQTVEDRYRAGLCAVRSATQEIGGTGFLASFQGKYYAVTCAHVLVDMGNHDKGSMVTLERFDGTLTQAEVRWCQVHKHDEYLRLPSQQDVAILEVISPCNLDLPLLSLQGGDVPHYQGETCWCIAYLKGVAGFGAWIGDLALVAEVPKGRIQLAQPESGPRIHVGASGAPLIIGNQDHIIGMVQAMAQGEWGALAYMIPSQVILKVFSSFYKAKIQGG